MVLTWKKQGKEIIQRQGYLQDVLGSDTASNTLKALLGLSFNFFLGFGQINILADLLLNSCSSNQK